MPRLKPAVKDGVITQSLAVIPELPQEVVSPQISDLRSLIDLAVTEDDWLAIFSQAKREALDGNARSREFLVKYRYGLPPQMVQHSGAVGMAVKIVEVVKATDPDDESIDAEVDEILDR